MGNATVRIGELQLRVPGLTADEASGFGEEVSRRVADRLPRQGESRELGALELSVALPHGASRSQMASLIAEAILKGLV